MVSIEVYCMSNGNGGWPSTTGNPSGVVCPKKTHTKKNKKKTKFFEKIPKLQ